MSSALLKPKGVLYRDLSKAEQTELLTQIPGLKTDPNYCNYKYYRTQFFKWIICNAFAVPLRNIKSFSQVQQ